MKQQIRNVLRWLRQCVKQLNIITILHEANDLGRKDSQIRDVTLKRHTLQWQKNVHDAFAYS